MPRLFWQLGVLTLCMDRRRSTLSVMGVALGVALLFTVNLSTTRARTEIGRAGGVRNVADLEIVPYVDRPISDAVYAGLLADERLADLRFLPLVAGEVSVRGGERTVRVVGVDLVKLPYFVDVPLEGWGGMGNEPGVANAPPAWVPKGVGAELGLHSGERIVLTGPAGSREVQLRTALRSGGGAVQQVAGNALVGDIAWVRKILGRTGDLTAVAVRVDAGDPGDARRLLEGLLPAGLQVQRPSDRVLRTREVIRAFNYNLTALSLMALLVGMFLVYNTIQVSVARRRTEIGILRSLGMTRREVAFIFVIEAAVVGAVGSIAGIAAGGLVAGVISGGVTATLRTLYDVVLAGPLTVDYGRSMVPFVWGTGGAILAGVLPAVTAARIAPAETVREGAFEGARQEGHGGRALTGAFLIVAGLLFAFFVKISRFPFAGFAGILVMTVGFVMTGGYLIQRIASGSSPIVRRLMGVEGLLAAEGLALRARRTAMAVSSIGVSLACAIGILLLTYSFRTTVERWVDGNLSADFYVKPAACEGRVFCEETLPSETIRRLASVLGVEDVYAFRGFEFTYRGAKTHIGFSDVHLLQKYSRIRFLAARPAAEIFRELLEGNYAIVSEPFSHRFGVRPGDVIRIPAGDQVASFTVNGIYYDYSTELGYVILDRRFLQSLLGQDDAHTVGLYVEPGVDGDAVRRDLLDAVGEDQVFVLESDDLRSAVLAVFDRTFSVTEGIYLVAIAIALLGVASTFFTLVLDRRREFAVLRYLGMERRGLFRMLLTETALVSVAGSLVGLTMGLLLGVILVFVINRESFGWSVEFLIPWLETLRMVLLMAIATILSAWWPFRVASRLNPREGAGRE